MKRLIIILTILLSMSIANADTEQRLLDHYMGCLRGLLKVSDKITDTQRRDICRHVFNVRCDDLNRPELKKAYYYMTETKQ